MTTWINISKTLKAAEGKALLKKWRPFYVNKGGDLRLQRTASGMLVLQRRLIPRDYTEKTMQWNEGLEEIMVSVYDYFTKYAKKGLAR